jgi:hypothetical protein
MAGNFLVSDRAARLAAAEVALTKALSLVPEHPLAHMHLGYVKIYTNRVTQGIAEFERALALESEFGACPRMDRSRQIFHRSRGGVRRPCA